MWRKKQLWRNIIIECFNYKITMVWFHQLRLIAISIFVIRKEYSVITYFSRYWYDLHQIHNKQCDLFFSCKSPSYPQATPMRTWTLDSAELQTLYVLQMLRHFLNWQIWLVSQVRSREFMMFEPGWSLVCALHTCTASHYTSGLRGWMERWWYHTSRDTFIPGRNLTASLK